MELAPKTATSIMISVLSASIIMGGFQVFRQTTGTSMENATTVISQENLDVNESIRGKQYPVIVAENQRITLNFPFDPKSYVSATDPQNGTITNKVESYHDVDVTTKGTYEVRYVVRNSYGLKTVKKIKVIVD